MGRPPLTSAQAAPAPQPARTKEDEQAKAQQRMKDLQGLRKVFDDSNVTIFRNVGGPVENVRIIEIVEVFGTQYLQVHTAAGKSLLIRTDGITTIREE